MRIPSQKCNVPIFHVSILVLTFRRISNPVFDFGPAFSTRPQVEKTLEL